MDLDEIWIIFLGQLKKQSTIISATKQVYSGTPFLYLECKQNTDVTYLEQIIKNSSSFSMKGKRLHSETIYVRDERNLYVYRHRFYVPQEKMFCCGNLCIDCIRLKKK